MKHPDIEVKVLDTRDGQRSTEDREKERAGTTIKAWVLLAGTTIKGWVLPKESAQAGVSSLALGSGGQA